MKDGHPLGTVPPRSVCLVVVADEDERAGIAALIRSLGFEVLEAGDCDQGLDLCLRRAPDIALVEWAAPGPNGVRFLKGMKPLSANGRTRVIFSSSVDFLPDIHGAMAAGAHDYLVRPFDADLLAFKLAQTGLVAA